jgi:hypothetical protein
MIDLVIRPLAGLLICVAFAALVLYLPTIIRHVRVWVIEVREGNLPAPVLSLIRQRETADDTSDRKAS